MATPRRELGSSRATGGPPTSLLWGGARLLLDPPEAWLMSSPWLLQEEAPAERESPQTPSEPRCVGGAGVGRWLPGQQKWLCSSRLSLPPSWGSTVRLSWCCLSAEATARLKDKHRLGDRASRDQGRGALARPRFKAGGWTFWGWFQPGLAGGSAHSGAQPGLQGQVRRLQ